MTAVATITQAAIEAAFAALPPDAAGTIAQGEMERVLEAAFKTMHPRATLTDSEVRSIAKAPWAYASEVISHALISMLEERIANRGEIVTGFITKTRHLSTCQCGSSGS